MQDIRQLALHDVVELRPPSFFSHMLPEPNRDAPLFLSAKGHEVTVTYNLPENVTLGDKGWCALLLKDDPSVRVTWCYYKDTAGGGQDTNTPSSGTFTWTLPPGKGGNFIARLYQYRDTGSEMADSNSVCVGHSFTGQVCVAHKRVLVTWSGALTASQLDIQVYNANLYLLEPVPHKPGEFIIPDKSPPGIFHARICVKPSPYPSTTIYFPVGHSTTYNKTFIDNRALQVLLNSQEWHTRDFCREALTIMKMVGDTLSLEPFPVSWLAASMSNHYIFPIAFAQIRSLSAKQLAQYAPQLLHSVRGFHPPGSFTSMNSSSHVWVSYLTAMAAAHFLDFGTYYYWALKSEITHLQAHLKNDKTPALATWHLRSFEAVFQDLTSSLSKADQEIVKRQEHLIFLLDSILNEFADAKASNVPDIIAKLRQAEQYELFPPTHLPLNPDIVVSGIVLEDLKAYLTKTRPIFVNFRVYHPQSPLPPPSSSAHPSSVTPSEPISHYPVIYKRGDDMRQDQFIINLIKVMDKQLKSLPEPLDLGLSPYSVISTGYNCGMIETVVGDAMYDLLRKSASHPVFESTATVELNNYVLSCAGYLAVTYILGIGDRHTSNIMVAKDGKLFHIDFGYVLGNDPKLAAPAVKLSRGMLQPILAGNRMDMLMALAENAYLKLRQSSSLLLSLVALMLDANISHVNREGLDLMLGRLHLEMTETEAWKKFEADINASKTSLLGQVYDVMHTVEEKWRVL
eukprot:TRINITY_DN6275_c0_g1_i1.p1 TRINITY_DN6275_c0_g1~~TRINITY_DN6275_c0_g1_i1.p1  ORF type:complete len:773 (+),score=165.53 TRINITY_DN6275_c0_g1_i1:101-2320(+)